MIVEIKMPRLGLTMKEGIVQEWYKSEGEYIEKGEVICLIANDKMTSELESPIDGFLVMRVQEGETFSVQTVIAEITEVKNQPGTENDDEPSKMPVAANISPSEEEEDFSQTIAVNAEAINPSTEQPLQEAISEKTMNSVNEDLDQTIVMSKPLVNVADDEANNQVIDETPKDDFQEVAQEPIQHDMNNSAEEQTMGYEEDGIQATPIARRMAKKLGINLAHIQGTGGAGRIVKEDVKEAQRKIESGEEASLKTSNTIEPQQAEVNRLVNNSNPVVDPFLNQTSPEHMDLSNNLIKLEQTHEAEKDPMFEMPTPTTDEENLVDESQLVKEQSFQQSLSDSFAEDHVESSQHFEELAKENLHDPNPAEVNMDNSVEAKDHHEQLARELAFKDEQTDVLTENSLEHSNDNEEPTREYPSDPIPEEVYGEHIEVPPHSYEEPEAESPFDAIPEEVNGNHSEEPPHSFEEAAREYPSDPSRAEVYVDDGVAMTNVYQEPEQAQGPQDVFAENDTPPSNSNQMLNEEERLRNLMNVYDRETTSQEENQQLVEKAQSLDTEKTVKVEQPMQNLNEINPNSSLESTRVMKKLMKQPIVKQHTEAASLTSDSESLIQGEQPNVEYLKQSNNTSVDVENEDIKDTIIMNKSIRITALESYQQQLHQQLQFINKKIDVPIKGFITRAVIIALQNYSESDAALLYDGHREKYISVEESSSVITLSERLNDTAPLTEPTENSDLLITAAFEEISKELVSPNQSAFKYQVAYKLTNDVNGTALLTLLLAINAKDISRENGREILREIILNLENPMLLFL